MDLGEAGRLPLVMLPTRPLRLRWLLLNRYRLLRRSDLHHLKAMVVEAFYSRGISRTRRNAGAHKAAEESVVEPFLLLVIWSSR